MIFSIRKGKRLNFNGREFKKTSDPNELRYNCPFCVEVGKKQDIHFHLYLNKKLGYFYCFRCGATGWRSDSDSYIFRERDVDRIERKDRKEEKEELVPLIESELGLIYWKNRGFSEIEAVSYGIFFSKKKNSLFFPVFDLDGKFSFYIERKIVNIEPRYFIPSGIKKSSFLYNIDKAKEFEKIWLVEGTFDAIALGPNSVAVMGKILSETQLNLLRKTKVKTLLIALDKDASYESSKLELTLLPYFKEVIRVEVEGKDPAELKRSDPRKIELLKKRWEQ
jgi:DNA primase